jgi:hypothetical protein
MLKVQAVWIIPDVNYDSYFRRIEMKRESWRRSTSSPKICMVVLVIGIA